MMQFRPEWLQRIKTGLQGWFARSTDLTNHTSATANVHGLPANVNALGNRSAAGEFIQRGTVAGGTSGTTAASFYAISGFAVTFPVAFTTTPIVLCGGTTSLAINIGAALNITTTGFTFQRYDSGASRAADNCGWVAFGK